MPAADVSQRMAAFEDRLCGAWENDALAALAANEMRLALGWWRPQEVMS